MNQTEGLDVLVWPIKGEIFPLFPPNGKHWHLLSASSMPHIICMAILHDICYDSNFLDEGNECQGSWTIYLGYVITTLWSWDLNPKLISKFFQLSPEIVVSAGCYNCRCDAKFISLNAHAWQSCTKDPQPHSLASQSPPLDHKLHERMVVSVVRHFDSEPAT